ncbi:Na+/H+ antiporter NhaC family protein [Gracilibacillus sp. S3-1-1]|uniref:Na+/H+ antiporter NhaC family protein n=1 Tax=Gracilibacillus pellucidus TaxID=3095368 RepID=A0ACC6M0Q0_9BACI|nr:Na+/H+ antiporter NhaC family protein [Gracilibacillus sp. S3-1-1]MDX8044515.1 Na+/H+ antiporter NhaC family protein [Gracilibacillus sp. S3-1-1]
MEKQSKGNAVALLPLLVFILLFIVSGIVTHDFSSMPINVAVLIAAVVAIAINRKEKLSKKIEVFTKGVGHENIILMVIIYILAGAFSEVAEGMGAVDATVNLGLSLLPANLLMVGLFIIACFISLTMGTSMGTVVALAPIGIGIAEQTDISMALAMATIIGGAMFGDNLSMISDTTIAAARTQNTTMSDKFKTNFWIILPGAIITIIILWAITLGSHFTVQEDYSYQIVKVLPYLAVLIVAILGVNVLIVLTGGIVFAGIIGLLDGSFTGTSLVQTASEGIINMQDIAIIALLIGGIIGIIQHNGGIDYLLHVVSRRIKSKKGAEFGIAGLVSAADISTANNTISIIMTGPLAKNIAQEYQIDPRKSASILDIFAACWQGILPYGAQMLAASGLAAISPLSIIPYSFYPILLGLSGIIAILIGFPRFKQKASQQE